MLYKRMSKETGLEYTALYNMHHISVKSTLYNFDLNYDSLV